MAQETLIEARRVTKSYWVGPIETPVLRGIDFSIGAGDRLAISGASGAGKSTLLHLLASLDPPTEGEVLFRGKDLYRLDEEGLARFRNQHVGFVFQFHHLLPDFSAAENVAIPLLIRGVARSEATKSARQILERLGLGDKERHRPSELSGGEQQRVAVARAVVGRPEILFADEPTGNLDQANGELLMEILCKFHEKEGMTLVVVTHNESLIKNFPQRFFLKDGLVTRSR